MDAKEVDCASSGAWSFEGVKVNHFCPELAEAEALRLIAELEEIRVRQLFAATFELEKKLEKAELALSWWEHLSKVAFP